MFDYKLFLFKSVNCKDDVSNKVSPVVLNNKYRIMLKNHPSVSDNKDNI